MSTAQFNLIGGSSYIPTPERIASSQTCLNVQNRDEFCFLYCVAASVLNLKKNAGQPHHYRDFISELKTDGLKFPLPLYQIPKFERLNPDYSVNVFYLDDETSTIMPLKVTKCLERQHHVDMLLLAENDKRHYILIKNLAGLFQDKSKHTNTCFPCRCCLRRCYAAQCLEKHIMDCEKHPPQVVLYPKPAVEGMAPIENDGSREEFYNEFDDILNQIELAGMRAADRENGITDDFPKVSVNLNDGDLNRPHKIYTVYPYDVKKDESKVCFKNFRKTFFVPFCFYLDFESYLVKTTDEYDREIHDPSGFCCLGIAKDEYAEYNDEFAYVYSGPDVMQHFYRYMRSELEKIDEILEKQEPMELTADEQDEFDDATNCHTCGDEFDDDAIACRHHDHVTGKYLAAVCQICNLQLKPSKLRNKMNNKFSGNQFFVPVICHNMRGYDSHHILKHLCPIFEENPDEFAEIYEIDEIASNTEKYIGFQMGALRFLDSLQFLNASSNTLVSNLTKDGLDNLRHTKRHFKDEELHLLSRKGIFPYSWFDDEAKMIETGLPLRGDFSVIGRKRAYPRRTTRMRRRYERNSG